MSGGGGRLVIVATLCIAMLLTILPMPEWARPFRPQWVTLVMLYWAIALPHRVGVGSGFVAGIILDVLTGTLLGQHALGLSVVTFIAIQLHQRIRVFPFWQQSLGILVLLVMEHLLALWVTGATRGISPGLIYWSVPLIGALLWPWIFVTLRKVRRHFKVS
ncbi:MAG: rod shape-determining protein MreD [Chromatiaceae bacterium]|nr:rod shape-determining protein MreD [Chromatiaceae bacterium]MCP5440174.1 rod shape-determining protein MreD [Chromatiaceae bacterium]HPE80958.1 rod shape-determining protein MreD [Gammaproteobacteria bacterium]